MAAVIVVLLTPEAAGVIMLLGAQVIAEIDRAPRPSREAAGAATGRWPRGGPGRAKDRPGEPRRSVSTPLADPLQFRVRDRSG
jgi:hypothetical protein